ncbi:MAG: SoxR reducing system RseC family protein [Deltaproteobacteria bacterium]|nr:SoxR reducing system RseC family protein [Candidatus Anaeroferrophillus wilburensis]MBN2888723.1 SoxR reducing system RseC family protein [Deltaproteobacteria bacterium]
MMLEEGLIAALDNDTALVRKARGSACDNCSGKGSCNVLNGGCEVVVRVANTLHARPGEKVMLEFDQPSRQLRKILFILVPLLALLTGGILGRLGAGFFPALEPQVLATTCGVVTMAGATMALYAYYRYREQHQKPPVMKKIIAGTP